MTVSILKRSPQLGPEESKPTSKGGKKKSVTIVIPEGVFGGRGKTEYKKTPTGVNHTGTKVCKRGRQSSITIQRKCAWYNVQHEAEKRGIDVEHPPEEWQKLFDTIKDQLEKPSDGERFVHDDGRLIWNIPTLPGGCIKDQEKFGKPVTEKMRFKTVESRKQKMINAEKRLLSNLTPVQSRWLKRRGSTVTRGLLAVLNAEWNTENKSKPTEKLDIPKGSAEILSSPVSRVGTIKEQYKVTRDITPCLSRSKTFVQNRSRTCPRTSYQSKFYTSGGYQKRLLGRKSLSARARRLMSMSRRRDEVTKKQGERKSLVQILRREFCKPVKVIQSPSANSQPDFVPFVQDIAFSGEGEQNLTVECEVKNSTSRNLTSASQDGPTSSSVHYTEVNMQFEKVSTSLVSRICTKSPPRKILKESKRPTSPVNLLSYSPKVAESKKDRNCPADTADGGSSKIPDSSVNQFDQQTSEKQQKRSSSSGNDTNKSINLTYSQPVTTPLQSPVISGMSTPLLEKPLAELNCEKPEKRRKTNQPTLSKRKKRRLVSNSPNIRPTEEIRSTEGSQLLAPLRFSPADIKNSISSNSVVLSPQMHTTPDLSKEAKKQGSKRFVPLSPSAKLKDIYCKTKPRSSKRIRARKHRANSVRKAQSFHTEVTLVTPQRLVLEDKKEKSPSLKTAPGGGKRLKPKVRRIARHSEVGAKTKVVKRVRRKAKQRQIRGRRTSQRRQTRSRTTIIKKEKQSNSRLTRGFNRNHSAAVTRRFKKNHSVAIQKVKEKHQCEIRVAPSSFDRLKNLFNQLEQNVDQMNTIQNKRFTLVFNKLERLEAMIQVLSE